MIVELGFIYGLVNPTTGEIFYVGATQTSLKNRLRTHYQHLREFERGIRKTNKRYVYLQNLRPLKCEIVLLELVINADIDEKESFYIKKYREINPNITNMTDGGKGKQTSKYYTEEEMLEYGAKLSKANKGKVISQAQKDFLSSTRKGLNNPNVHPLRIGSLVCFKDQLPVRMFKYGFEINNFIGSKHAGSSVVKSLGIAKNQYGYEWKKFDDCTKEIQDIVQSLYENLG